MKRMVENSEKIEELADAVENSKTTLTFKKQVNFDENVNVYGVARYNNGLEVNNGDLVTSNITTPGGEKIPIFSKEEVDFLSTFPGSIVLFNLGTALLFEVTIQSGTTNGNYPIARILRPRDEIDYVKISNGNEFNPGFAVEHGPSDFVITTEFNETLADHTSSEYRLVLLIGHYSKES